MSSLQVMNNILDIQYTSHMSGVAVVMLLLVVVAVGIVGVLYVQKIGPFSTTTTTPSPTKAPETRTPSPEDGSNFVAQSIGNALGNTTDSQATQPASASTNSAGSTGTGNTSSGSTGATTTSGSSGRAGGSTTTVTAVQPSTYGFLPYYEVFGTDIKSFSDETTCNAGCDADPLCDFYVVKKDKSCVTRKAPTGVSAKVPWDGTNGVATISYVKSRNGYATLPFDIAGTDIKIVKGASNVCDQACTDDPNCSFYASIGVDCYLKKDISVGTQGNTGQSGVLGHLRPAISGASTTYVNGVAQNEAAAALLKKQNEDAAAKAAQDAAAKAAQDAAAKKAADEKAAQDAQTAAANAKKAADDKALQDTLALEAGGALVLAWTQTSGQAVFVSTTSSGETWVLGAAGEVAKSTTTSNGWGGFGTGLPKGLVKIAAGLDSQNKGSNKRGVWGIDQDRNIYQYDGSTWKKMPGAADWISSGKYVVCAAQGPAYLYQYLNYRWDWYKIENIAGASFSVSQISIDDNNNVWIVTTDNKVFNVTINMGNLNSLTWGLNPIKTIIPRGRTPKQVETGPDGVWLIMTDGTLYKYNGDKTWKMYSGILSCISVGKYVWGTTSGGGIYVTPDWSKTWKDVGGVLQNISTNNDGDVWGTGPGDIIYKLVSGGWTKPSPGAFLREIVGGKNGNNKGSSTNGVWGFEASGQVYQYNGKSFDYREKGNKAVSMSSGLWVLLVWDGSVYLYQYINRKWQWCIIPNNPDGRRIAKVTVDDNNNTFVVTEAGESFRVILRRDNPKPETPNWGAWTQIPNPAGKKVKQVEAGAYGVYMIDTTGTLYVLSGTNDWFVIAGFNFINISVGKTLWGITTDNVIKSITN